MWFQEVPVQPTKKEQNGTLVNVPNLKKKHPHTPLPIFFKKKTGSALPKTGKVVSRLLRSCLGIFFFKEILEINSTGDVTKIKKS